MVLPIPDFQDQFATLTAPSLLVEIGGLEPPTRRSSTYRSTIGAIFPFEMRRRFELLKNRFAVCRFKPLSRLIIVHTPKESNLVLWFWRPIGCHSLKYM